MIYSGTHQDDDSAFNTGSVYIIFLASNAGLKTVTKISASYGGFSFDFNESDSFGRSLAGLGDVNGDACVDLAVGAMYDDDGATNAGALYIVFLETDGSVKDAQKISNTYGGLSAFFTLASRDYFGSAVAALGDLDGDSIGDLAVGAHSSDDSGSASGAVYLLFIGTDASIRSTSKISNLYSTFNSFYTLDIGDYFGYALSTVGVTGSSGIVQLVVGAYSTNSGEGSSMLFNTGGFYVITFDSDCIPAFPKPSLAPIFRPSEHPTHKPSRAQPTSTQMPTAAPSSLHSPSPTMLGVCSSGEGGQTSVCDACGTCAGSSACLGCDDATAFAVIDCAGSCDGKNGSHVKVRLTATSFIDNVPFYCNLVPGLLLLHRMCTVLAARLSMAPTAEACAAALMSRGGSLVPELAARLLTARAHAAAQPCE